MTISGKYRDEALMRIARGLIQLRPNEQFLRKLLETSAVKPKDGDVGREVQRIIYNLISHDRLPES